PGGAFPGWDAESLKKLRSLAGKRELPLNSLPALVRFRDMYDPLTVEQVSPEISERFGPGTRLLRATLELVPIGVWPLNRFGITGEPVTTGIEKKLPWLSHLGSYNSVAGNSFTSRLPSEVNGFSTSWGR